MLNRCHDNRVLYNTLRRVVNTLYRRPTRHFSRLNMASNILRPITITNLYRVCVRVHIGLGTLALGFLLQIRPIVTGRPRATSRGSIYRLFYAAATIPITLAVDVLP